jgi:hypothetical protein
MHALTYLHETVTDAVFICSTCGEIIGFNKEGIGEPHASLVDGVWTPPENPDQWMSPCTN